MTNTIRTIGRCGMSIYFASFAETPTRIGQSGRGNGLREHSQRIGDSMPDRPFRPCKHSGCSAITRDKTGYCEAHIIDAKQYDKDRGSPSSRGYDLSWQRLRECKLNTDPLCEDCLKQGIYKAASQVHHKQRVSSHPGLRLNIDNLISLCASCHSARTARGE